MTNIYLEGIEILNDSKEFEYIEENNDNKILKDIFKTYKAKVGKIGHYNYRTKELKELLNSEPGLMDRITKLVNESKNKNATINKIVDKLILSIKDDEKFLDAVQSTTVPSDSRIASSEFENKNNLTEMLNNLYTAIAYINKGAKISNEIKPISISNIKTINDDLFGEVFDQLNLIDNPKVDEIKKYFQKHNLIGNSKILWPNTNIKFPDKLDSTFINKYFGLIQDQSSGTKLKESNRLNRNAAKIKNKEDKNVFDSIDQDLNYAIDNLKNQKYDENIDSLIEQTIEEIIKSRSESAIKKYLINKSEHSRYNFDSDSDVEDALYEIIATEIHLNKLGRKKK